MSGWLAIGLIVIGLVGVACVVLIFDVVRGDVGGGRHTMARARRLLVVADARTEAAAEEWISEQRAERPELQCFLLTGTEGQELFMDIQYALERDRPDAIVMVRTEDEHHWAHAGTFGRLKDEQLVPVDAIFVEEKAPA